MRKMQLFATLIGVATLSMTAAAQTPLLLGVARVNVKPDRLGEYMDVEKQYAAAYKKGGGTLHIVYRNRAGNPFEFMVVTSIPNYAALDGKSPYAKGTTETELAQMAARRAQCVVSVRTTFERTLPEVSLPAATDAPLPKMILATRLTIRMGMTDQYLAAVKSELIPALKKAGVTGYLGRRVEWGGGHNQFTFRRVIDMYADLDGESGLAKAIGKEAAAKWTAKVTQFIASSDYTIDSIVPELSFRQPQ